MDTFSQIFLTLTILISAVVIIWAISIFIWGVRSGGNWHNPIIMFEYFANLFFHRLNYSRRQRKRAYHQSVIKIPAAPDVANRLSKAENEFFFLHELELHMKMELAVNARGEVEVTKRQFKRLEQYLAMAPNPDPYEAFAHHGVALRVKSQA